MGMKTWLISYKALVALAEDLDWIPSTHMVVHYSVTPVPVAPTPLLTSHFPDTHADKTFRYIRIIRFKKKKNKENAC